MFFGYFGSVISTLEYLAGIERSVKMRAGGRQNWSFWYFFFSKTTLLVSLRTENRSFVQNHEGLHKTSYKLFSDYSPMVIPESRRLSDGWDLLSTPCEIEERWQNSLYKLLYKVVFVCTKKYFFVRSNLATWLSKKKIQWKTSFIVIWELFWALTSQFLAPDCPKAKIRNLEDENSKKSKIVYFSLWF